jgi:hypothetical protein
MSARVENLTEKLRIVNLKIETSKLHGNVPEELLAEQTQIETELRRARSLLTEGSTAKVLRG